MRRHPGGFPARLALLTALALWAAGPSFSRAAEEQAQCRFCTTDTASASSAVESSAYRKYTPDKRVSILHLALDITPDFRKRTIQGQATLRFEAVGTPLEELRLDAVDLNITQVSATQPGFKYHITEREIVCTFEPPLPVGKEASVSVEYSAEPAQGLYFRTREMGYTSTQLWTQGESIESRHWFPCIDHPMAKFTSEVTCHLPEGMIALSNGRQISATPEPNGLTAFHWLQDKPHANYLIALVAGELAKVEDKLRDVPLEFWTAPEAIAEAPNSFKNTKNIMEFLEHETGVDYPWAKYAQVAIQDYHWGGMENTSLTTLTSRTLFNAATENLFDSNSLVAHELAHQWFGDLVTCKNWSHIWLNEGFATYYEWLWQGEFGGPNETLFALHNAAVGILGNTNETRGIVWQKFKEPGEMFNYLAYPKGAWVLHMLRCQLGTELYRKCIHTYIEKHSFGSVTTDDLRAVIEEVSGRSFERFFAQWVSGIGAPVLDVDYSWDDKASQAKITVKQTQKISEDAHLFQFPMTVRLTSKEGTVQTSVQVLEKEESFYFPLKSIPDSVRINPDLALLAKINFKPTRPMLLLQLADDTDMPGQLLALEQLAEKPDSEAVAKIAMALQSAQHYGVKVKAAETLQKARTDEALAALTSALSQSDARVRNAVVKAVGGFYSPQALSILRQTILHEKNPGIIATALRALGAYQTQEVRGWLSKFVNTASFRERLAEGAIAAMRAQDDPPLAGALLDALRTRGNELPSATLAAGLEAVGALQRNERNKDASRDALLSYLSHPKQQVRLAAITGLGNLEDSRSIPALETFASASAYRAEKPVAEKALEKIRAARKPNEELQGLRTEISSLQDAGRELKKEVETLRKRLEAIQPHQ